MRHSVNAEQPMAVPESTETTEDTSDTPVTVEDIEFQSPRKKKVMEDKNSNASSSMPNLAKLKLTTLQIGSAASGVDAKVPFERIDFVISDQTAHNIDVELLVAKELGTKKVPNQLFCNVHPCLMFNRVIVKHRSQLEHAIGLIKYMQIFL